MAKPPDFDALARQYLELLQDHYAGLAADPKLADSFALMFGRAGAAAWPGALQNLMNAAGGDPAALAEAMAKASLNPFESYVASAKRSAATAPSGAASPGAAPVGAAPGDRGIDAADLARRLAAVEGRLAALEARLAERLDPHPPDRPERRPQRRKSRRVR
ncbi:MAG: hypothetical protein AB7G15_01440 [Alphaproteobacteria bacterium]